MRKTCAIAAALLLATAGHVQAQDDDAYEQEGAEEAAPAPSGRTRGPLIDQGEDAADAPDVVRPVRVSTQPIAYEDVDEPEDEADAARHALAARNWAMMRQRAATAPHPQPSGYPQAQGYAPAPGYPSYAAPGYPTPSYGQPAYGAPQYMPAQSGPYGAQPYSPPGYTQPGYAPVAYQPQAAPYAMTAPDLPAQGETGIVRIPRDSFTGHFVARVLINGVRVRAVIDTGAVSTVLSPDAARATGAINDITHTMPAAGIGGVTMLNVTRVRSFVIGGRNIGGFDAMIGAGAIQDTLLGQTELRKLGRIVIEDDVLTIEPKGARLAAR